MSIAAWLNNLLSPTVRKYLHIAVTLVATVATIWGLSTDTVSLWVALVVAVGGLGSQILSAILTKRPDMTVLYSLSAAVIAALVAMRFLNPSLAAQIDNTLAAVVAVFSGVAFARTDTSTPAGSPANEAKPPMLAEVVPVSAPSAVSNPNSSITVNLGDGTPPVTEGR
jgi:hypothetical protein